jgi:hypothetical protein
MSKSAKRFAEVREVARQIKLAERRGGTPAVAELAELILKEWGGTAKFLRDLKAEIYNSDMGSVARQRGYALVMALVSSLGSLAKLAGLRRHHTPHARS